MLARAQLKVALFAIAYRPSASMPYSFTRWSDVSVTRLRDSAASLNVHNCGSLTVCVKCPSASTWTTTLCI